ncbi:CaiB/BaiF CoA transferase family protein [Thermogemmatispora sp.]|uniref:CaiB/BaiF CoA transferase family protein n=1 Tax=Thermogemmatispora sp. TaxID=1968838 RepID=UPI001DA0ED6E|nr:CaiB/BaiF CoA-transferase family protein [Thermogemmatispora sp.]MBX5451640.1 CoA transferase [Thermogemmatispora sp.]
MTQPLSGIRVLDLSRLLPGGYASQLLADFGADVIKVEEPGSGDYGRNMPPYGPGGMGLAFLAVNRNKRSLTLNLKSDEGRAIFLRLVRSADVLLESFRPGVMARLGLGYEQLREIRPELIYCAISGYGQDGPYSQRAGHDLNYLGYAGLLHYNRDHQGRPVMPPTQLADLAGGGLMAVIGILAALVGRHQSGQGRFVDVSMTEGAMALLPLAISTYLTTGQAPQPGHSPLDGGLPCYNIYETRDGGYITLAALEPKFWHAFCTRIGHLELLPFHTPVGPEERKQAIAILQSIFKTKTRDEWLAELADLDACVGPVYSLEEALSDPHAQARGVAHLSEIAGETLGTLRAFPRLSDTPQEERYQPPRLGEHTAMILSELGYSQEEIASFRARGII